VNLGCRTLQQLAGQKREVASEFAARDNGDVLAHAPHVAEWVQRPPTLRLRTTLWIQDCSVPNQDEQVIYPHFSDNNKLKCFSLLRPDFFPFLSAPFKTYLVLWGRLLSRKMRNALFYCCCYSVMRSDILMTHSYWVTKVCCGRL
jgi:hypothetical protein